MSWLVGKIYVMTTIFALLQSKLVAYIVYRCGIVVNKKIQYIIYSFQLPMLNIMHAQLNVTVNRLQIYNKISQVIILKLLKLDITSQSDKPPGGLAYSDFSRLSIKFTIVLYFIIEDFSP